jgi:hypothetical protein
MSNLFKKVRIVHSPDEERYYVEQRRIWAWRWELVDVFGYVKVRSSSPHGCHDLVDDAFEKAKKKAEMLLARSVVWEQTNYTWGP